MQLKRNFKSGLYLGMLVFAVLALGACKKKAKLGPAFSYEVSGGVSEKFAGPSYSCYVTYEKTLMISREDGGPAIWVYNFDPKKPTYRKDYSKGAAEMNVFYKRAGSKATEDEYGSSTPTTQCELTVTGTGKHSSGDERPRGTFTCANMSWMMDKATDPGPISIKGSFDCPASEN